MRNFLAKEEAREKAAGLHVKIGPFDEWLTPKFSCIAQALRLTEDRIQTVNIGDHLLHREKEMVIEMLFNREKALSLTRQKKDCLQPEIKPPHMIRVLKDHVPWQKKGSRVLKLLRGVLDKIVTEFLQCGDLEPSQAPYRSDFVLVAKNTKGTYRLIASVL